MSIIVLDFRKRWRHVKTIYRLTGTWRLGLQLVYFFDSLRRRANARNVSIRISLRWLTYIVNSVDKTKLSSLTLDIHVMINWYLSKQGICWPVSRDHIAGSSLQLIEVMWFFWSWPLTKCWFFDWIAGSYQVNLWKGLFGSQLTLAQD